MTTDNAVPLGVPTGPQIAVVGAGPSGCYTAQALRKELLDAQISIFDALPVPFGLIRYGVAADHQGTKAVSKQFARLFEKDDVRFVGGVTIGEDIDLVTLQNAFDVVVLAHGLHGDSTLDVPGTDLDGVIGAGRVTRLLNGHALESRPAPLLGSSVAIVGMGNVAMDLVRLLAKTDADFADSDVDDDIHSQLASAIQVIHLIGRSQPVNSKFDPAMARELLNLTGVEHVLHGVDDAGSQRQSDSRSAVIAEILQSPLAPSARIRVEWWFGYTPSEARGDARVEGLDITRVDSNETITIAADSVISAIGFTATPNQQLARVSSEAAGTGRIGSGLYVAGWARRGPRGTIPSHRADSRQLATVIAGDLARPFTKPGIQALEGSLSSTTTYAGWLLVDAHETSTAANDRVRRKVTDIDELRAIARAAWGPAGPSMR